MSMDESFIICDENEVDDQDGNEIKKEEAMSKQRKKLVKPRSHIWDRFTKFTNKNMEKEIFFEAQGFRYFCSQMQNKFVVPFRMIVARDCYEMLLDERLNLNKRILNFCLISSRKGQAIGKAIEKCLLAWGLENVMTITVDNVSSNDTAIAYKKQESKLVNDGLKLVTDAVCRVQGAVKFILSSPSRIEKFYKCVSDKKIPSKNILYWHLRGMMGEDPNFHEHLLDPHGYGNGLGKPTTDDWDQVKNLVQLLEVFYNLTLRVSEWCESPDYEFKEMAKRMKEKCDSYWGDPKKLNVMLYVVAVLNPRYKWKTVEFGIIQMYTKDNDASVVCTRIKNALYDLYDEYKGFHSTPATTNQSDGASSSRKDVEPSLSKKGLMRSKFKKLKESREDGELTKTEADKYLDEVIEEDGDGFDISTWWKNNSSRFPILSLVTRDVLAIPVSTVASESAFRTGGRVLDSFRSSLSPKMAKALISCQDWLRASSPKVEECLEDIAQLENELLKINLAPSVIDVP
ncbi:zinc finger BED domain-containing protein RICESLEEPER 2-like [Amaranthus tricolor]|uniref:zinc finger BED domain-containing protein RICESLEEPER 2-like n=1 Tax=Amaranthus tricolor TaxID=29722 RepID=UPI0025872B6C|nr:zinc finger BED domain-containing protein RICESLEEPER 2-like [Amaranthus tricolor]